MTISLDDIRAARARIAPYVRRTPLLHAQPMRQPVCAGDLYLKLENLQVTGSFKARGAMNTLLSLDQAQIDRGLVTASGGNHGLAVAYAGWIAKKPAVIYLPQNAPKVKADQIRAWDATVKVEGAVWDDSNVLAQEHAQQHQMTFLHSFADPRVIAGQGTTALEIFEDLADVDVLLVAIGGGGLMAGVSSAARAIRPNIKIIGVEPTGAPTLYESVRAGKAIMLPKVETQANTLAPRQSHDLNVSIIKQNVDDIVLVSDDEMCEAAKWLWHEFHLAVEMSAAACMAALAAQRVKISAGKKVCAIICGAGTAGID